MNGVKIKICSIINKKVIIINDFLQNQRHKEAVIQIKMEIKLSKGQNKMQQMHENSVEMKEENYTSFRSQNIKVNERTQNIKQVVKSQSPISHRIIKSTSKTIEQLPSSLQQITSTQSQIHQLIDELDLKMKSNYQLKESNLIETYRQQLIQAHKDLTELKNNINEQQIKNQMNEKFLEMKKQRLELIQSNMLYSNKCIQYKKLLEDKVAEGNQLEKEILFLEKQINNSNQKKVGILSQLYQNHSPLKNYQPQKNQGNSIFNAEIKTLTKESVFKNPPQNTPHQKSSLSTLANTQVMKKISLSTNSNSKGNFSKMPEISSQVKKIFQQKIIGHQNFQTDRSSLSIKNPTILSKISALNSLSQEKKTFKKQQSEIESFFLKSVNEVKEKRGSRKEATLFKCEQFTDIQKKQIMKTFLSKQQVKQYIYNIIFDKSSDSVLFNKKPVKDKFKIVAEQNKQLP